MTPKAAPGPEAAGRLITKRIESFPDWRGETLARMRALIHEADPAVEEQWKWMGTPCFYHGGSGVCTGEVYKEVVKLTFFKGAALADPALLFNSGLEGNTRRAIDIREGETVDAAAFIALFQAGVAANSVAKPRGAKKS